ncbi:type II toxin-antitoxin system RelE family toxin [Candidatus Poriferisodalis sp.]|uniref:type II toxin-antitoxin system RelE family toxin n=1 Tax=Candidatus Poriferisodalis sp. TaxID=3101277 RepID=UPI003B014F53
MPDSYRIELSPAAQRQARRLTSNDRRRVRDALRGLVETPRTRGSVKLTGFESVYRIRVGQFRVVYEIHDDEHLVMVLRIARRDEATYRQL